MSDTPNYNEFPDHREMTRCAAPFRKAQASIKAIIDDMRRVPHSSAQFLADCLTDLLGEVTAFVTLSKYDAGPDSDEETKALIDAMHWKQAADAPPAALPPPAPRASLAPSIGWAALAGAIVNTTGGA